MVWASTGAPLGLDRESKIAANPLFTGYLVKSMSESYIRVSKLLKSFKWEGAPNINFFEIAKDYSIDRFISVRTVKC